MLANKKQGRGLLKSTQAGTRIGFKALDLQGMPACQHLLGSIFGSLNDTDNSMLGVDQADVKPHLQCKGTSRDQPHGLPRQSSIP